MIKTILIILLFILLCLLLVKSQTPFRETFTNNDDKFVYKNNDLYSAMKKAISCKDDNEVLYKLVNYKNKHLNKSVNEFKKLF